MKPNSSTHSVDQCLNDMMDFIRRANHVIITCAINYHNDMNPWYLRVQHSQWNDLPVEIRDDLIRNFLDAAGVGR